MLLLYLLHTLFLGASSLGTQSRIINTIHHFYDHSCSNISSKYQQCLHSFSFSKNCSIFFFIYKYSHQKRWQWWKKEPTSFPFFFLIRGKKCFLNVITDKHLWCRHCQHGKLHRHLSAHWLVATPVRNVHIYIICASLHNCVSYIYAFAHVHKVHSYSCTCTQSTFIFFAHLYFARLWFCTWTCSCFITPAATLLHRMVSEWYE